MMDQFKTITLVDRIGRNWTMTADVAVVGFRWRIYCYRGAVDPQHLEALHPGGVSHGWTESDPSDAEAWLRAVMMAMGATPREGS